MEFGLRKEIHEKIKEVVKRYEYIFLIFGSRARGDYKDNIKKEGVVIKWKDMMNERWI